MTEVDVIEQEILGADQSYENANINEEEILNYEEKDKVADVANTARTSQEEDIDLFDEAVAPSQNISNHEERVRKISSSQSLTPATISSSSTSTVISGNDFRYHCYIGNLTWWTTDADLLVNVASLGVSDILDLKFFENRINGQSKGFVLATFGSETSLKNVLDSLPNRMIHGSKPAVLSYTKQNLAKLEESSAKTQTRPDIKKKEDSVVNMGTIRIGTGPPPMRIGPQGSMAGASQVGGMMGGPTPMPLMMNGQQPQMQPPMMNRPMGPTGMVPPGMPVPQMTPMMPMQPPGGARPLMGATVQPMGAPQPLMSNMASVPFGGPQPLMGNLRMGMPPPGAHVNPNIFNMAGPPISEAEFEEIMNRNRTVSSSAISRAMSDAHTGDVKAAIETLQTAMNLIKSSRVAHDERCRILIDNLEDALRNIDSKGGYSSRSSRSYRDRRSRSRSRDRRRRRRTRSRSGSRSRSRSPPRHRSSRHY